MSITTELREWWVRKFPVMDRELHQDFMAIVNRINGKVASDYVQLPTDAKGMPFRVGDHVEVPDGLPSEGKPWQTGTITRLELGATCWHVHVLAGGMNHVYLTENVRHAYEPTVEDVLREFAQKMNENIGMYMGEAIDADEWRDADAKNIAEYAAKLRLAGENA